jgi:hypothetical protein
MEAIQTEYQGYKFRSRLEARWAVFFENLGIKWLYEPEGFVLSDSTRYLPDFLLPDISIDFIKKNGIYLEVKPEAVKYDNKWELFSETTNIPIMLIGDIPYPFLEAGGCYEPFYWPHIGDLADGPYLFCECKKCGKIGLHFDGRSVRIDCSCEITGNKEYNYDSYKIQESYKKARQARFEYGETPC